MPPSLTKQWIILANDTPITPDAERELSAYSSIMRQLLFNRGYRTHEAAKTYLNAQPPSCINPMEMKGVPCAVERIWDAIGRGERIAVYGDYDVDGVTATALLTELLRKLGAQAEPYIPNRFDEGYGLNIEALDTLSAHGVNLVITVDCGIRSLDEAEYARRIGLDLIITDHHHPQKEIPEAIAVINPKQAGDTYPDKDLAGVGIAYKLGSGILERAKTTDNIHTSGVDEEDYLDLVALGTVSDQAPLVGENRSLVRRGLEQIRYPKRQGVLSLIGVAGLKPQQINAENIGFGLGPRLNAAGRIESALAALNLLLTTNLTEAASLAQQLDNRNRERQQIMREIQVHAEAQALAKEPDAFLLFSADASYNPGVIGLAANRLMEQYYRPAIVAQIGPEFTRGSCRSIPEFHITAALDECKDLLIRHGGHAAAAGFTVKNENLPELIERLRATAKEQLDSRDLRPKINADMEIKLSELKPSLLNDLGQLQPSGQNNPAAKFVSRGVRVKGSRSVGKDNSHLRLIVSDGRITYDAIAFRFGHLNRDLPDYIDLLYQFEINEYNEKTSLQLNVQDISW